MTRSAQDYHKLTSYDRFKLGGHGLDWGTQPNVFKTYPGFKTVSLPQVAKWPEVALSALVREQATSEPELEINKDLLGRAIILTHSLTAKARYGGQAFYYRSVASAGALYPYELYVGTNNVPGLEDGIYHHSVSEHALTAIRAGNMVPELEGTVEFENEAAPTAVFFLTSIFFRSSWKYRDRAYRYNLLDTGHMAESLVLALSALGMPFEMTYDFNDQRVNRLLIVDEAREVCLVTAAVWGKQPPRTGKPKPLEAPRKSLPRASTVASREVDYPTINAAHMSALKVYDPEEGAPHMLSNLGLTILPGRKLVEAERWPEKITYSQAVFKRRSNRNFVQTNTPADILWALLEMLCKGGKGTAYRGSVSVGFLAQNVDDVDPGFYLLDMEKQSISLAKGGNMMEAMSGVCLGQRWLRKCALQFVFLSNLAVLHERWGNRGYRYAMLDAGRLGHRLYMGATAMQLGCCGIGAFFDDEASKLLGLSETTEMLYLVAAGPIRKWSST